MTAEADIFVDVDIPGLSPVLDTSISQGIEPATKPTPDDTAKAIEQITRERDAWKQRAEGGDAKSLASLAEAQRAREAAEARAGQAAEGELRAKWNETVNQHETLAAGVIQMKDVIETSKRELASAIADENITNAERGRRVAEAQSRMSLAAADLRTLEQGEADAKNEIERMKRTIQAARAAPPPEPAKPPVQAQPEPQKETPDQWIARFPQKTQEWLKAHPDYVSNTAMNEKLVTFAKDYHDGGSVPLHDDNFIKALNKRFGFGGDDVANDVPVMEVDTTNHASTRAAAPVSRNNAPTGNNNAVTPTGRVRLSGEERNTAIAMFPNDDQNEAIRRYARNKAEAIRDGKYAR